MAKTMETGKMLSFEDLPLESLKTETNISNMSTESMPASEKNTRNGEETVAKEMETGKMLSFENMPPKSLKTKTNTLNTSTNSKPTSEKNTAIGEETIPLKLFYNEILSKEESENRINILLTIISAALSIFLLAIIIIIIALLPHSPKIVQVQTAAKSKQGLLFT